MTSPLDIYREDLRIALRVLLHARSNLFGRPSQRHALDAQFLDTASKAAEKLRLADRVAAQKRHDAALAAAQSDEKLIRGLRADIELQRATTDAWEARVAELTPLLDQASERIAQLEHAITELQGQAATHECLPLPQRHPAGPQWSDAAQEPPGATETAKRPTSRTGGGSARPKPAAKRTAPRPTVKEG